MINTEINITRGVSLKSLESFFVLTDIICKDSKSIDKKLMVQLKNCCIKNFIQFFKLSTFNNNLGYVAWLKISRETLWQTYKLKTPILKFEEWDEGYTFFVVDFTIPTNDFFARYKVIRQYIKEKRSVAFFNKNGEVIHYIRIRNKTYKANISNWKKYVQN